MSRTSTVYLLHFEPPYTVPTVAGWTKRAGHYLGSCAGEPEQRLAEHVAGRGSPLVLAAVTAGSTVTVVRTWPGSKRDERRLKRRRRHSDYCPTCRARQGRAAR